MKTTNKTIGGFIMKNLLIIISLFFAGSSFANLCPESTDLTDLSARHRCFYKILQSYQKGAEKAFIKEWQKHYRNTRGNLDRVGVLGHPNISISAFKAVFKAQKLLDSLENTGVYYQPAICQKRASSSSNSD